MVVCALVTLQIVVLYRCFNWIQLIPAKDNPSDLYRHSLYTAPVASTCSFCLHVILVMNDRKAHMMGQYKGVVALHHSGCWHMTAASSRCSDTVGVQFVPQTHHTAASKWSPGGTLITGQQPGVSSTHHTAEGIDSQLNWHCRIGSFINPADFTRQHQRPSTIYSRQLTRFRKRLPDCYDCFA